METTALSRAKPSCEQIDAAISANEEFVEFALSSDAAAMLDYAGFKLRAQAAATALDWTAISVMLAETSENWVKVKTALTDKAVQDLGESIQTALTLALTTQNSKWLDNSAQILLDSVDLIERQIKNPAKGACH